MIDMWWGVPRKGPFRQGVVGCGRAGMEGLGLES